MRKHYLDNIRWGTQIIVVLYHVFYMYNAEGVVGGLGRITSLDVQYWDIFQYIVYPWMMPVLFMVSGICAKLYLDSHTASEFIRSRTRKLLIPSTLGLFVFQFIQGYISMSIGGALDKGGDMEAVPGFVKYIIMAFVGSGVLWFLQLLWVLSVVLVLIRKIEKGRLWDRCAKANVIVIALLSVLLYGSAQVLNLRPITVFRVGLYMCAFLLGYFVFSHDEVMELLKRYFPFAAAISAVLCIAFCAVYFGENYAEAPCNRSLLYIMYAYFGCIAILGGAARYADFENGFTRWMNKRSFGLYIFHYMGISAVALFIAKPGLVPAPAVYVLSLMAGFAAGFGLNAVISRIPFFRWAVMGISRKDRKNVR